MVHQNHPPLSWSPENPEGCAGLSALAAEWPPVCCGWEHWDTYSILTHRMESAILSGFPAPTVWRHASTKHLQVHETRRIKRQAHSALIPQSHTNVNQGGKVSSPGCNWQQAAVRNRWHLRKGGKTFHFHSQNGTTKPPTPPVWAKMFGPTPQRPLNAFPCQFGLAGPRQRVKTKAGGCSIQSICKISRGRCPTAVVGHCLAFPQEELVDELKEGQPGEGDWVTGRGNATPLGALATFSSFLQPPPFWGHYAYLTKKTVWTAPFGANTR